MTSIVELPLTGAYACQGRLGENGGAHTSSCTVAKRLPMDDPTFVNYLRIGYITAQLIAVAVYFYCQMAAKKKNDLTVLKYVNPASPMVRRLHHTHSAGWCGLEEKGSYAIPL